MSDIKCPFCKEEIISDVCCMFDKKTKDYINGKQIYKCNKCGWYGNKELWQELIRTRRTLETLQEFITKLYLNGNITDEQLERYKKMLITALKQKETKCQ